MRPQPRINQNACRNATAPPVLPDMGNRRDKKTA